MDTKISVYNLTLSHIHLPYGLYNRIHKNNIWTIPTTYVQNECYFPLSCFKQELINHPCESSTERQPQTWTFALIHLSACIASLLYQTCGPSVYLSHTHVGKAHFTQDVMDSIISPSGTFPPDKWLWKQSRCFPGPHLPTPCRVCQWTFITCLGRIILCSVTSPAIHLPPIQTLKEDILETSA